MEFTKNLEQLFNTDTQVDQAEKGVLSVLSYVQPRELADTLTKLTVANFNFARSNIEAFKGITAIAKTTTDEFTKSLSKSKVANK
jgi:hypothetical protein